MDPSPPSSFLDQLTGVVPEPLILCDAAGVIRDANAPARRMLGLDRETLVGARLDDLVVEDARAVADLLRLWARSREALPGVLTWRRDGADPVRMRCDGAFTGVRDDGGAGVVAVRCRPQALAVREFSALNERIASLTSEIRRREVAEQRLNSQREWLRVVLRSIGDAVIATDRESLIVFMNPIAEALTGWPIDNAAGRSILDVFDIVHETTRERVENPVDRVLREGVTVGLANHTVLRRPDGSEIPIDDSGAPIRTDDGQLEGAVLVFRDITERHRVEAALREREARFRQMADHAPALIWMSGLDKGCYWFNRPWLEFTGRTLEQEQGNGWAEGVHPDDFDRCLRIYTESFDARRPFRMEYRLRRRDGVYRWLLNHGHPMVDESRAFTGFIGSCIDITDLVEARRTLENHRSLLEEEVRGRTAELHASYERLRASERMASLGTLSAGLGHDIGNLLLPMRARLDALRESGLPPAAEEHLEVLAQCLEYLRRLTGGLRLLAQDPARAAPGETTELSAWWTEVEALLRNVLPGHVELRPTLPAHPVSVRVGRVALTQMVFNLVQNAGDALRGRAEGLVEVIVGEPAPDGLVTLTVADNGPGMDEATRARCLEPFFTTKPREFSTGLGLALVHSIAGAAGGGVRVESEPGHGARFILSLPLGGLPGAPPARAVDAAVTVGDPRLRSLIVMALKDMGCRPREHAHGTIPAGARLWVSDGRAGAASLRCFVEGDPAAWAVLVGDAEIDRPHERLVSLGAESRASALRHRLRELAQELVQ